MMEFLLTVGEQRAGATGIPPPVRDRPKTNLPIGTGVDHLIVIDLQSLFTCIYCVLAQYIYLASNFQEVL